MYGLSFIATKLSGFVFEEKVSKRSSVWLCGWNPNQRTLKKLNLMHPSILSLLPNASTIIIKTDAGSSYYLYPFSMLNFVEVISKISTWNVIKVEQYMYRESSEDSWIYKVWKSQSSELEKEYGSKQLKISYNERRCRETMKMSEFRKFMRYILCD